MLSEGEGAHNCTAADSSSDHETHTSDSEYSEPGILESVTVSLPHCVSFRCRVQFLATSATAGRGGEEEERRSAFRLKLDTKAKDLASQGEGGAALTRLGQGAQQGRMGQAGGVPGRG